MQEIKRTQKRNLVKQDSP